MENLNKHIYTLRKDFSLEELHESIVEKDPILQFSKWFKEAMEAEVPEANAMILSTAGTDGRPSSRVLLLRSFNEKGFVFYTNYYSRKGKEIMENPWASMLFFWPSLERQIRIEGKLEQQSSEESEIYFNSRPRESKLGAWVSEQSKEIKDRKEIEVKLEEISGKYPTDNVPRPPYWGGYVFKHHNIEFWQGRPSRLHDRILYTSGDENWKIVRLAP